MVRSRLLSRCRNSLQMGAPVVASLSTAFCLATFLVALGSMPLATSCNASAAPLRAAARLSVGHRPKVNLVGLPPYLYRSAQDLWPDGCSTRKRPEPPSLISRRCGPGLKFSIAFAVSFLAMCYPECWGVTNWPVLLCYPVSLHTAEQFGFVKEIRVQSAPPCSGVHSFPADVDATPLRARKWEIVRMASPQPDKTSWLIQIFGTRHNDNTGRIGNSNHI